MSTWFPEQVTCPHCAHAQTARLAHGVHVARAPEVREQMFARTFHVVTCAGCAKTFVAQRQLIYTDMDRKHWVQVALADETARWPEYEVHVDEVFERAFTGAPIARELAERMKVRLVFGLDELREKLVIWRANLDDRAMECMKLDLVRREPALVSSQLFVESVANRAVTIVVDRMRSFVVDADTVMRFDSDSRLAAQFPEIFGGRYVSYHRLTGPRYRWAEP